MDAYYKDDAVQLHLGEALDVLPTLPDASVDAVVCDPPYALAELPTTLVTEALAAWLSGDRAYVPATGAGFMGRDWDRFVPPPAIWDECLRVLKPGGHLLAFSAPRTQDLMGLSIRLAGFRIFDGIDWIYGSGMPKGQDISKAIDKAAGAVRPVVGTRLGLPGVSKDGGNQGNGYARDLEGRGDRPATALDITAPATPDAARWEGWNTQLKPAHETITVARKPFTGTFAANVLRHGTGALNIDGCRTTAGQDYRDKCASVVGLDSNRNGDAYGEWTGARIDSAHDKGRWPTNVILSHPPLLDDHGQPIGDACADGCVDGCPVAHMDRQSGVRKAGERPAQRAGIGYMGAGRGTEGDRVVLDSGGASRFYPIFRYEAKAPKSERPRLTDGTAWPTVKPVTLIRWLVRLVTPPGGTVLDWCAGTGTTLEAARLEGLNAIGVEREHTAADLSVVRLNKPYMTDLFGGAA